MSYAPTRYIASFTISFISDFMRFSVEKYGFSVDEIAIICLVASESIRDLRGDAFAARNYGTEDVAFPNEFRKPVSLKFVHVSLGLSRETARRKLESLVERGFLNRGKRGYTLPAQMGSDDYTKDLRKFLVRQLVELETHIKKTPQ